jgi:hypothetical protein
MSLVEDKTDAYLDSVEFEIVESGIRNGLKGRYSDVNDIDDTCLSGYNSLIMMESDKCDSGALTDEILRKPNRTHLCVAEKFRIPRYKSNA